MPAPTLFERVIRREIPADIIHEDEVSLAFRDIHPQAPVHLLVIPKKPIPSLSDLVPEDAAVVAHLVLLASRLAKELGLLQGYRLVANCGGDGGQTVPHLHFHLLGGRPLSWPPG